VVSDNSHFESDSMLLNVTPPQAGAGQAVGDRGCGSCSRPPGLGKGLDEERGAVESLLWSGLRFVHPGLAGGVSLFSLSSWSPGSPSTQSLAGSSPGEDLKWPQAALSLGSSVNS
jgi:hypothetical protein